MSAKKLLCTAMGLLLLAGGGTALSGCPSTDPPEPDAGATKTFRVGEVDIVFRYIRPGSFLMGSRLQDLENSDEDEYPQKRVTLTEGFWMSENEITMEQYNHVMGTFPWLDRDQVPPTQTWSNAADLYPAVYIDYDDANDFVDAVNGLTEGRKYYLPSEAQWEYACRADTATPRFFEEAAGDDEEGEVSQDLADYAWYKANTVDEDEAFVHTLDEKLPNAWGLRNMYGNVAEWCRDVYGTYPNEDRTDPVNSPFLGGSRVLRGGAFFDEADEMRSPARQEEDIFDDFTSQRSGLGIRLCREYDPNEG